MVGTTRATTALTNRIAVRSRTTTIARAESPMQSVATSASPSMVSASIAFAALVEPSAETPSKSGIWPRMMLTAMPVRNPIITECDTKRVYRPSQNTPAATIATPAKMVRRNSASARSASGIPDSVEPAARAAALVVVMTINRVFDVNPPAIGPKPLAYRP